MFNVRHNKFFLNATIVVIILSAAVFIIYWYHKIEIVTDNVKEKIEDKMIGLSDFKENIHESKYVFQKFGKSQKQYYPVEEIIDSTDIEFDTLLYINLWEKYVNDFGLQELDSLTIDSLVKIEMKKTRDTLNTKEVDDDLAEDNEDIFQIRKDILLNVITIIPEMIISEEVSQNDTLNNLASDDIKTNKTLYTIEFWKSPLNFKGYKASRNLIIIYGIEDFKKVKLLTDKQMHIFLMYGNKKYPIKKDGNFYSF